MQAKTRRLYKDICSAHMRRPGGSAHRFFRFKLHLAGVAC